MRIESKKSLIAVALLIAIVAIPGCGNNKDKVNTKGNKAQFDALLDDFTNWDNTKQRVEKRHQNIVLPIKKYFDDFSKLSSSEQQAQAKIYTNKVDALLKQIPEDNHTIRMEARNVVYARRYGVAVKNIIEAVGKKNANEVKLQDRSLLDSWLGYMDAYKVAVNNQKSINLTNSVVSSIKLGQSYTEIANLLHMPGECAATYVLAKQKDSVANEVNVWTEGDSYLIVRFKEGKAVEIIPKLAEISEENSFKINNPLEKLQAKLEIGKFDKKLIIPAKEAYNSFHRDFGAFCKQNKDGNARNKKRAELAAKYYNVIKAINLDIKEKEINNKVLEAKKSGLALKNFFEKYLEANSKILDPKHQVRAKAWRDDGVFYRKVFDAQLEYNHLKNAALLKDETYSLVARGTGYLKVGHNYFTFANAYRMPGKLISSEMIKAGDKNIHQEIYLWSLDDAYCLATFHNGRAVNIKQMGIW